MRNPLEPIIERHGVVLLDGGLATELERRGADLSDELWSARLLLDDPELIISVALDYLRAGSDAVCTASYQASREGFAKRGLTAAQADALLARSVTLAREACRRFGQPSLVAASLGPYGAFLADGSEYRGDYALSVEQLVAFHRPRVDAVLGAAPDLVLFETLPSLREAQAVAHVARALPDVAFMATFTARDEAHVAHGEPFADVVRLLDAEPNVVGIGVNCVAPALAAGLLRSVGAHRASLVAKPNSGEAWDAVARRWTPESTDAVGSEDAPSKGALNALDLYAAGARIIGGCCRTTPEDLARARADLERTHARG